MAAKPESGAQEVAAATTSALQSSIRELCISNQGPIRDIPRPAVTASKPIPKKKAAAAVADSWEDEAHTDEEDLGPQAPLDSLSISPVIGNEGPLDPPPTPISPQTSNTWTSPTAYTSLGPSSSQGSPSGPRSAAPRRPEKQTAVAGRLIAGALGIRAPKRTEEQRAYDRAIREQEMKRRNREKEEAARAEEEEELAKAAVWND